MARCLLAAAFLFHASAAIPCCKADDPPIAKEQAELRAQGQAAFYAADYEKMAGAYIQLLSAEGATIDDGRWLGHAFQLSSQWQEAADVYAAVVVRMDQYLDQRQAAPDAPLPQNEFWPTADRTALQERAATLMMIGRIQRYCLKNPAAAEVSLRRVLAYGDVLREPVDDIARKWRARLAEIIGSQDDSQKRGEEIQKSLSLRFPMFALHDLAAAQQSNGNYAEALKTWERVHWITRHYIGHGESCDTGALQRLIQVMPAEETKSFPAVTFLDENRPAADFDLSDVNTLAKAYDLQNHYWTFALAAPKPLEFASLEFTCDIEQLEVRFGGQFESWLMAGDPPVRKGIGHIYWPNDKPAGRDKITQKYSIEPGAGLVHFRAGRWKDKFKVHGVKVAATFRPMGSAEQPAEAPVPGFIFHTEFLPEGGSVLRDNEPYTNNSTAHNVRPGRHTLEFRHPRLPEPRRFSLDFRPGGSYSLFLNLDSPFTPNLTNLREFFSQFGPTPNLLKLPDGRWLVAWCRGGVRFATSADGVAWSAPIDTDDAPLFNENYNTLAPTLYIDKDQTIWVAYFSNQLDIDQLNTGGYRLFLRSSRDGKTWSPPRPLNLPISGWPPGKVQFFDAPGGKVWLLYRLQYAEANTPAGFREFQPIDMTVTETQKSHARNPYATIDEAGRVHLVWDNFAQTLYYSRRDPDGTWSEPIEIEGKEQSPMRSDPYLIVRGNRLALIYGANQTGFLRRGSFRDGQPTFGQPIKIASHTVRLIGISPVSTSSDRVTLLTGANTVWTQTATIDALLGGKPE